MSNFKFRKVILLLYQQLLLSLFLNICCSLWCWPLSPLLPFSSLSFKLLPVFLIKHKIDISLFFSNTWIVPNYLWIKSNVIQGHKFFSSLNFFAFWLAYATFCPHWTNGTSWNSCARSNSLFYIFAQLGSHTSLFLSIYQYLKYLILKEVNSYLCPFYIGLPFIDILYIY